MAKGRGRTSPDSPTHDPAMQTRPTHQFTQTDLQAVRDFLASETAELRLARPSGNPRSANRAPVAVHHGINRARIRSAHHSHASA